MSKGIRQNNWVSTDVHMRTFYNECMNLCSLRGENSNSSSNFAPKEPTSKSENEQVPLLKNEKSDKTVKKKVW